MRDAVAHSFSGIIMPTTTETTHEPVNVKKLCQNLKQLEQLLSQGFSPNAEVDPASGRKLIHQAVKENSIEAVRILAKYKCTLDAADNIGKTAVNVCLEYEKLDILIALLESGADPNKSVVNQESTLHVAASISNPRFAEVLLQYGATVSFPDFFGDWPLHKALFDDNNEVAQVFAKDKSTSDQINKHGARGLTPLHIACQEGDLDSITIMMECPIRFDLMNTRGETAIDILLGKEDSYSIELIGRLLVEHTVKGKESMPMTELLKTQEATDYFKKLRNIDNEYQHNYGIYESNRIPNEESDRERTLLLQKLEKHERMDLNEFINVCVKAAKKGFADDIIEAGFIAKIADNVLRHILLPQNEAFLQEIMSCGLLWANLIDHMETDYLHVYQRSLTKKKDGIKGLIARTCIREDDKKVSSVKLHKLVCRLSKMWGLQGESEVDEDRKQTTRSDTTPPPSPNSVKSKEIEDDDGENALTTTSNAMTDPVKTMSMWCILTGRLKLVPYFLRQEDHDVIPLALLMATVLRALAARRDIEDVFSDKAEKMATKCEGIAMQALRRVKDMDSSPNNILTMEYVRLPLCGYGDYTILDLAARGGSSKFVTIDVVQESLDMEWFKDFSFCQGRPLSEATIAMGFIPPLMLFVPKMMKKCKDKFPEYLTKHDCNQTIAAQKPDNNDKKTLANSADYKDGKEEENIELLPQVKLSDKNDHQREEKAGVKNIILGYLKDMNRFYHTPCVKFRVHVTCHVIFILLLSYTVISDYRTYISNLEYFSYATLLGFFMEEISEMINCHREESLVEYFKDGWNIIDLVAIFCGLVAFIMRTELSLGKSDETIWYWALVLLSTTCLVYWIRLLYVSVVLESLGPKLKMMSLMIKKDFLPFLYILFVLMFGFGVTFQSLLYPNGQSPYLEARKLSGSEIFIYMFKTTFYTMVGDYGMAEPCPGPDEHRNRTHLEDNYGTNCVHHIGFRLVNNIYLVIYIVISQILLLNLIVAMFSKTIDEIDNVSKAMWQFEKYDLIEEFQVRSALPPPFNTISEVRNFIMWVAGKLQTNVCTCRPVAAREDEDNEKVVKTFLLFQFYQAVGLRNYRHKLTGVVQDEEDLDEASKILFNGINEIKEKLEKVDQLEEAVINLQKLLKNINVQGTPQGKKKQPQTTNLSSSRLSVRKMSYMDDGGNGDDQERSGDKYDPQTKCSDEQ